MVAIERHELIQSLLIGIVFSFLVAKLISVLHSFRVHNLHLVRGDHSSIASLTEVAHDVQESGVPTKLCGSNVEDSSSVRSESSLCQEFEEDGLEGIENSELDDAFSAASSFVAAAGRTQNVPIQVQLQLYGLYKIATEGPCGLPKPSSIKMPALAKWQAWHKLGSMPPLEAMEKYIEIVTTHYPFWTSGSNQENMAENPDGLVKHENGPMGPVFSTLMYKEEFEEDLAMDELHAFAQEGDVENLMKCLDSGVPVNMKDDNGRTALHWAVDRGQMGVVELLVGRNADVNAVDDEGQTPLHYAAICDREEIAKFLVAQNADVFLQDNDSESPYDLRGSGWQWMHSTPKSRQG